MSIWFLRNRDCQLTPYFVTEEVIINRTMTPYIYIFKIV